MRPCSLSPFALLGVTLVACVSTASAATVSGTLGPQYGSPLVVQASQSNVGGTGDPSEPADANSGSQLNAAYGYISNGTLYVFCSGNLTFWLQLEGQVTHWMPLDLFIDSTPGGQHQLLANNPAVAPGYPGYYNVNNTAGLTFDDGFAADYWLSIGGKDMNPRWPSMSAYFATLPTGGGGSGAYLGSTASGPRGVLTGGTNPDGIQVAFDDDNRLGLGSGCGPANPTGVSTGIEWAIPLAAIGNPTGCVRVCACVVNQDHSMISNQVLGPLPPGTCSLTPAAATDFSSVPGDQFFTICPSAVPARNGSWGSLKALYR